MAKTRTEGKRVAGGKTQNTTKKPNPRRTTQGVAKPKRPRGRSIRIKASKGVVNKPKDTSGRPHRLRSGEEVEVLAKRHTQFMPKAQGTNNQQEDNLMASNEANIATVNKADAQGFLAINSSSSPQDAEGTAKSVRKSERINAAL
ncbi:hypothetical protein LTS18_011212, partial [Coniosporium uncinatum]